MVVNILFPYYFVYFLSFEVSHFSIFNIFELKNLFSYLRYVPESGEDLVVDSIFDDVGDEEKSHQILWCIEADIDESKQQPSSHVRIELTGRGRVRAHICFEQP